MTSLSGLVILMTATAMLGFQHGDRPAPNSGGTRSPVLAMNGMVATSQPLASAAALRVLEDGGNAVDAAITAAAVLNVVEPVMTGIGGDMFALIYMQQDKKPVGLNGSGWAGSKATVDFFRSRSLNDIPGTGMYSVSVPGAVAGWSKLHQKYGKLPISRLLAPAIEYAEKGFPVSEIIAGQWQGTEEKLRQTPDAARVLLINGRAPRHGEIFKMPELARSLRAIAEQGRDAFYKGEIARKIVEFSNKNGGMLTLWVFQEFEANWSDLFWTIIEGTVCKRPARQLKVITFLRCLNSWKAMDL